MKFYFNFVYLWFGLLSLSGLADTFLMKDGSEIKGIVLKQDATSYVVEIQFAKGIKDERVIAKNDVVSIVREKPDVAAFEAIAELFPIPDSLTAAQYDHRIHAVEKFLTEHRSSSKSKVAKEMLVTLKSEANAILAGAVKLDGKIISPTDYRANAYDIDARIGAASIKRMIYDARYLEALREFLKFESDFRNTSSYDELVPMIKHVIGVYAAGISQSLSTFDDRVKDREAGLNQMPLADRNKTINAIAQEAMALENRYQAQNAAKIGWLTPHPFHKQSLVETLAYSKLEIARLGTAKKAEAVDGGRVYREALLLIQDGGNNAAVTTAISAAKTAGVSPRYIENLQAAAKDAGLKP
jgi:hypothetical protein